MTYGHGLFGDKAEITYGGQVGLSSLFFFFLLKTTEASYKFLLSRDFKCCPPLIPQFGLRADANENGWILAATDWIGLSQRDVSGLAVMIASDLTNFPMLPDQCAQVGGRTS